MRFRLPFCLLSLALAGCAGPGQKTAQNDQPKTNQSNPSDQAAPSDRYEIIAPRTPFYKYGPAQAQGPDLSLRKGVVVTLIKRSSGFSRVRIPEGEEGYVPNDRLAVAPPEPEAPLLRVDNPQDPEWLKVVPLDQMLPEEAPLPLGAGENLNRSNLSNSHGQHDHQ